MKIRNGHLLVRLSYKSLIQSKKRNLIAVVAIILTTVLFTSLFTMGISLNDNYQDYNFKLSGTTDHGVLKNVTLSQVQKLSDHPLIESSGTRLFVGVASQGPFAKEPAEVSAMSPHTAKVSFCWPDTGRLPQSPNEVALDRQLLDTLGFQPEIGQKISLNYRVSLKNQSKEVPVTKEYKVVGLWDYNPLIQVHFINVSPIEARQLIQNNLGVEPNQMLYDLSLNLKSDKHIEGDVLKILADKGYQGKTVNQTNFIDFGVNWAYTSAKLNKSDQVQLIVFSVILLGIIIVTGYLIIHNIFLISIQNDIQLYGLLKTIGTSGRQLKRMILIQALLLSIIGIPVGLILGYGLGGQLLPIIFGQMSWGNFASQTSLSVWIFWGSSLFALMTVLLSIFKSARVVSRISPIEAVKYVETRPVKKTQRASRGAKVYQLAYYNVRSNLRKFVLVVASLSLSVFLLSLLVTFTNGFDMERYLNSQLSADFIIGSHDYFHFEGQKEESKLGQAWVDKIKQANPSKAAGSAYLFDSFDSVVQWDEMEMFQSHMKDWSQEDKENSLKSAPRNGNLFGSLTQFQIMDPTVLKKLKVLDGDINPMLEGNENVIAAVVELDDYGHPIDQATCPSVGSEIQLGFLNEKKLEDTKDYTNKTYRVCAQIAVPYSISSRFTFGSHSYVMETQQVKNDSGLDMHRIFYLLDSPNASARAKTEDYLAKLTYPATSPINYQSKKILQEDFEGFRKMFLIIGGALCGVIALIGLLNFMNSILTNILTRQRELAILQAIGMTRSQLQKLLIFESSYYVVATLLVSLVLIVGLSPVIGQSIEKIFWFYRYQLNLTLLLLVGALLIFLAILIPLVIYRAVSQKSVVEQLNEL